MICLSAIVNLFACLSAPCPSLCLSNYMCLSDCICVFLFFRKSVYPSVCLSVCVSAYIVFCLFRAQVCPPTFQSLCRSVCLPLCLSVHLLVCLPVCLFICISVCLEVFVFSLSVCLSNCLPVGVFVCVPICPTACLPSLCFSVCLSPMKRGFTMELNVNANITSDSKSLFNFR